MSLSPSPSTPSSMAFPDIKSEFDWSVFSLPPTPSDPSIPSSEEHTFDPTTIPYPCSSVTRPTRKSHARKQPPGHIPRPANAFILFRSDFVRKKKIPASVEHDHRNISRIAGKIWKAMEPEERKPWEVLAEEERRRHKEKYPGYRYTGAPPKASEDGAQRNVGETSCDEEFELRSLNARRTPLPYEFEVPVVAPTPSTSWPTPLTGLRRSSSCPPPGAVLANFGIPNLASGLLPRDDCQRRPSRVEVYHTINWNDGVPNGESSTPLTTNNPSLPRGRKTLNVETRDNTKPFHPNQVFSFTNPFHQHPSSNLHSKTTPHPHDSTHQETILSPDWPERRDLSAPYAFRTLPYTYEYFGAPLSPTSVFPQPEVRLSGLRRDPFAGEGLGCELTVDETRKVGLGRGYGDVGGVRVSNLNEATHYLVSPLLSAPASHTLEVPTSSTSIPCPNPQPISSNFPFTPIDFCALFASSDNFTPPSSAPFTNDATVNGD